MPSDNRIWKLPSDDILFDAERNNLIGGNYRLRHRFPAPLNPRLLALDDRAGPDEVRAVNDYLAGQRRPGRLELPEGNRGAVRVATVIDMDADDVHQIVERGRDGDARLPRLRLIHRHQRGTFECGYYESPAIRSTFALAGRAWGHGFALLTEVAPEIPRPAPFTPPAQGRRPVIALLDTAVDGTHPYFPRDDFLIDQWTPPTPIEDGGRTSDFPFAGVEASHGTFIAGLIRTFAPLAQVRSLNVMRADGGVDEHHVIDALTYVLKLRDAGEPVDAVQMSFGRTKNDDVENDLLDRIEDLLRQLASRGVELVASAGNEGSDTPTYPAAFTAAPEPVAMHGVGSGSGPESGERDPFSNFGPWVTDWCDGSDQVGPLRDKGWGQWSGTSFAVPVCAAGLVDRVFPEQPD